MSTGDDQLERMLTSLRDLPKIGERAAPEIARAIEGELRRTIAAGTTPEGIAWEKTAEGKTPLSNAAKALGVAVVKGVIYVQITGPEVRHHRGWARGGKRRPVIPTGDKVPPPMAAKVREILTRHFREFATGGTT